MITVKVICVGLISLFFMFSAVVSADDNDEAMVLFKQAVERYNDGDFEEASKSFRKANEIAPSWRILYNIGQCSAALKQYGRAIEEFEKYLSEGGDEITPDREESVLAELTRLRQKVGTVEIKAPPGMMIFVDGIKIGKTPIDTGIPISARREHVIKVEKDNTVLLSRTVNVGVGQSVEVEVTDAPGQPPSRTSSTDDAGVPEMTPGENPGTNGLFVAGIVTAGVGLGLTGMGVGFFVKAKKDAEDLDKTGDPKRFDDLKDSIIPRDDAIKVTGLVAGGALMAAGVVMMIIGKNKRGHGEKRGAVLVPSPMGLTVNF